MESANPYHFRWNVLTAVRIRICRKCCYNVRKKSYCFPFALQQRSKYMCISKSYRHVVDMPKGFTIKHWKSLSFVLHMITLMCVICVGSFTCAKFKAMTFYNQVFYSNEHLPIWTSESQITIKDGFGSKFCALCLRMILFKREITRLVFWTTRNSDKHYQAHWQNRNNVSNI